MKCPNCKSPLKKGDAFCSVCGYKVSAKKKVAFPVIIAVIAVVLIAVGIGGWLFLESDIMKKTEKGFRSRVEAKTEDKTSNEPFEEDEKKIVPSLAEPEVEENIQEQTLEETPKEQENLSEETAPVQEQESEYILPSSAERLLTESDIQGLSLQELNYAKNEIYARHGRMFDSPELQNYFNSKQWYEGKYSAEDFDANYSASLLSDTEKKNTEFLKDAEYKLSPSGYQLDQ